MLALKLGLSLNSSKYPSSSAWSPTDESSLEAWYQKGVGVTESGGDISAWADSSTNGNNITTTAGRRPAYSNGVLTFTAANEDFLSMGSHVILTGEFTVGFKAQPTATNVVLLGNDGGSTEDNDFFKYTDFTQFTIRINGTTKQFLDSGTYGDDYIVITRDSSNLITIHRNGTALSDTETLSGTVNIDIVGFRGGTELNDYEGTVEELQFFSSTSSALTANVNARLAGL
tara:strand:+ start:108 stop:794 length:687 start_codon:yes stop_codon:yes gene_type:complete